VGVYPPPLPPGLLENPPQFHFIPGAPPPGEKENNSFPQPGEKENLGSVLATPPPTPDTVGGSVNIRTLQCPKN